MATTEAPAKEPANSDTEPLLELDTLAPRRATVLIRTAEHPDGRVYELRLQGDFGIAEQQELARDGEEYDQLYSKRLTSKERTRLKMLLDRMFNKVLDAPQGVKDQLDDEQRKQVLMAFTYAPFRAAAQKMETETEKTPDQSTSDT